MSWRVVTLQNPAQLSLKNSQLVVVQGETMNTLPVEDLCAIVLDSPQITITSALLGYLQTHNVTLFTCDGKHHPNGVLFAFHQHSRLTEVAHVQQNCSLPLKKRLWQRLVQQKIINQAQSAKHVGKQEAFETLRQLVPRVESGDTKNLEAYAARFYWPQLFGPEFKRHGTCLVNGALNYGYAIVRGIICRALVAYGLLPCFGVHHKNDLNAFNLADDMIEPFRPMVDILVYDLTRNIEESHQLSKTLRQQLLGIAIQECRIKKGVHVLHNVAEIMCQSLVTAMREKDPSVLELPELIE
jgi:CRISPR-associated protein Cas1